MAFFTLLQMGEVEYVDNLLACFGDMSFSSPGNHGSGYVVQNRLGMKDLRGLKGPADPFQGDLVRKLVRDVLSPET